MIDAKEDTKNDGNFQNDTVTKLEIIDNKESVENNESNKNASCSVNFVTISIKLSDFSWGLGIFLKFERSISAVITFNLAVSSGTGIPPILVDT